MYNLLVPKLCATLLVDLLLWLTNANAPTLYCAVLYIVACVDVSRKVFRDRSLTSDSHIVFIIYGAWMLGISIHV